MKRIEEKDYTLDIVVKISNWSSSNFKTNLFRIPNERIHHDNFINGILHALTETKESSIFPQSSIHTNSFVPELIHYFDYYIQLANRRGWPTELLPEEKSEPEIIITELPTTNEKEKEQEKEKEKEKEREKENELSVTNTPLQNTIQLTITPEQQMSDYRERQKQRMKEKKDKEEQEAQEKEQARRQVIQERHHQEDLVQQQLYAQQQQQAAQFEERQRQLQQQELQERQRQIQLRILQQQLQNIQRLQHQFREHLRQKHLQQNQTVDPSSEGESAPEKPLECAGPLEIDPAAEGYEVIEGNVNVVRYIEEDKEDHMAFRVGDSYYLASKNQIRSMINQGEKGNSLFYGCLCEIEDDWTLPTTWALLEHTVITNTLYFNIQQLGLPIRYLDLKDVMKVLNGTDNYFLIEKPKEEMVFPSFASDDILNHGIGSMSGSHCQDGQMDIVYIIKRYA